MVPPLYVYYCSGHGFGHATRVSAFASQLLSLPDRDRPSVYIVSSAPKHVFSDSIALGAHYRYADWIDPVIVQPLAYRVDRHKSVEVLKAFLKNKDSFLETEREWLISVKARCVLSDAAFLGCLAAKAAGVPSILITNFTFDSVYSYLATTFIDDQHSAQLNGTPALSPDVPISHSVLEPLVSQIIAGYRSADLLLLLPGHIPIPSFPSEVPLPSTKWVDSKENRFHPEVIEHLMRFRDQPNDCILHDHVPFPSSTALARKSKIFVRKVLTMPLLVRPPSSSIDCSPYTREGRARILQAANVPPELCEAKVLVVSFGGQVLKWPGRKSSSASAEAQRGAQDVSNEVPASPKIGLGINLKNSKGDKKSQLPQLRISEPPSLDVKIQQLPELEDHRDIDPQPVVSPRLATLSHIWIPGAPPVANPLSSPLVSSPRSIRNDGLRTSLPSSIVREKTAEKENDSLSPTFSPSRLNANGAGFSPLMDMVNMVASPRVAASPVTPRCAENMEEPEQADGVRSTLGDTHLDEDPSQDDGVDIPQLLPDSRWIAIVCGASQEQREDTSDLPENFYLAPKDVYMPDLTAVADVLLGKLGYGTVAECIDAGTPMVYVSRPLFIEELGLRILLEKEGVGVEMSRQEYEGGRWVERVREAWEKARVAKEWKRKVKEGEKRDGACEIGEKEEEIRNMAKVVVNWVEDCWKDI
ncbi:hypothetical protein GYMLUDRAFT_259693 [Collybiopsis luxurians FD-317 M1]|uniref:L-arabinokinase n=1 Tax=Collybiopsis luxurians FD-317 M1 TaxID=944289 RepID=A0A0D0CTX0_9AGAR|nr:hypothetical protein GYMLUDRAFT_259693 [Collybiopsis luxurians FD-317 M1]